MIFPLYEKSLLCDFEQCSKRKLGLQWSESPESEKSINLLVLLLASAQSEAINQLDTDFSWWRQHAVSIITEFFWEEEATQ